MGAMCSIQDYFHPTSVVNCGCESFSILAGYGVWEIPFLMHAIHDNLFSMFPPLSVISNKSGLFIQSNCNSTEYLCGP